MPALLALRCSRTFASIISSILGFSSVDPVDLVAFLQKVRRQLRSIKYQGQRNIRQRQQEATLTYMMANGQHGNDGGVVKELLTSLVRGICYQKPEVLDSLRDMLVDAKKLKKTSVRFGTRFRKQEVMKKQFLLNYS